MRTAYIVQLTVVKSLPSGRRSASGVLLVGDRVLPVVPAERDGPADHVARCVRSVPVALGGRDPHRVARADSLYLAALGEYPAATGDHEQELAALVGVPVRPRTWGEEHVVDRDSVGGSHHGIAPHLSGECCRALFGVSLCDAALDDFHRSSHVVSWSWSR